MPRQLHSTVTDDGTIVLSIAEVEIPEPREDQVVIRVEAAPINPSDLGPMFGPADLGTVQQSGDGSARTITAEIPERFRSMVQARVGVPVPIGNEGAGTVVAAGSSDAAQALLGKTVATWAVRCTQSCASRATPPWCTPPPPPTSARCW